MTIQRIKTDNALVPLAVSRPWASNRACLFVRLQSLGDRSLADAGRSPDGALNFLAAGHRIDPGSPDAAARGRSTANDCQRPKVRPSYWRPPRSPIRGIEPAPPGRTRSAVPRPPSPWDRLAPFFARGYMALTGSAVDAAQKLRLALREEDD